MRQFVTQVVLFAVVGTVVCGVSRLLRCRRAAAPVRMRKRSALEAIGAVGISTILVGTLIVIQHLRHEGAPDPGPRFDNLGALLPQLILSVVYVVPAGYFMIRNHEPLWTAGITRVNLWQAGVIGLGLAFLTLFFRPGLGQKLTSLSSTHAIALLFYALVGFGEEFLFRGYLQTRLVSWLGTWGGWCLASVIMAFVHFPHRLLLGGMPWLNALGSTCALLPVSFLMGFVMLRVGNLLAPGLFHTFANWVNTLG